MKKMLVAVFEGEGKLALKEIPVPEIKTEDEVLLEVEAASICGTDVHILEVPPGHPATPGTILSHEYVGRVLEVGKGVTRLKAGDRVVVDPNLKCGSCSYCKMGMPNMCENMTTLGIFIDGGFARYNAAPAEALHPISPHLPSELAVFAEPLSCVVNATQKLCVHPGKSVVVLGAGPIGLLFTQMFKASGAGKILVSEISEYRARFAQESGVARRGGQILLFGQNYQATTEITQNDITRNELVILGSFIAKFTFPPTIKIIESRVLNLEKLITHKLSLSEIHRGIEAMRNQKAIKVVITP